MQKSLARLFRFAEICHFQPTLAKLCSLKKNCPILGGSVFERGGTLGGPENAHARAARAGAWYMWSTEVVPHIPKIPEPSAIFTPISGAPKSRTNRKMTLLGGGNAHFGPFVISLACLDAISQSVQEWAVSTSRAGTSKK